MAEMGDHERKLLARVAFGLLLSEVASREARSALEEEYEATELYYQLTADCHTPTAIINRLVSEVQMFAAPDDQTGRPMTVADVEGFMLEMVWFIQEKAHQVMTDRTLIGRFGTLQLTKEIRIIE